jgi:hypothetical protein
VKSKGPVVASIVFHDLQVMRWLLSEHQRWLGVARWRRASDMLSPLPDGGEVLPEEVNVPLDLVG